MNSPWTVTPEPFDSAVAAELWRAYYTEVSDRWYLLHEGHTTDPDELEREVAADTGAYLAAPGGVLLVARYRGEPAGTAGVRMIDASTGELKRVFVRPEMRGQGRRLRAARGGRELPRGVSAPSGSCSTRGATWWRPACCTRATATQETAPHNDDVYAEHWFAKKLL